MDSRTTERIIESRKLTQLGHPELPRKERAILTFALNILEEFRDNAHEVSARKLHPKQVKSLRRAGELAYYMGGEAEVVKATLAQEDGDQRYMYIAIKNGQVRAVQISTLRNPDKHWGLSAYGDHSIGARRTRTNSKPTSFHPPNSLPRPFHPFNPDLAFLLGAHASKAATRVLTKANWLGDRVEVYSAQLREVSQSEPKGYKQLSFPELDQLPQHKAA